MRKSLSVAFLAIAFAVTAAAAPKIEGTTTLQRFNPVGATGHHHQQFDLFFATSHRGYTCRTSASDSVNATDFVAGSDLAYKINGNKARPENHQRQTCRLHHRSRRGFVGLPQ